MQLFEYQSHLLNLFLAVLHRFENEILFEELNHWPNLHSTDFALTTMAAVLFEKHGSYWLYHKSLMEDDEQEK